MEGNSRLGKALQWVLLARLGGFEPPTRGLEVRCSVLLSYRRTVVGKGHACLLYGKPGPCQ